MPNRVGLARAIGMWRRVSGLSTALDPLLRGQLADAVGWRSGFCNDDLPHPDDAMTGTTRIPLEPLRAAGDLLASLRISELWPK